MDYKIEIMPKAIKDIKSIPKTEAKRIAEKINGLRHALAGDVKKLTNFTPEYRLRVGNWRVLFEVEDDKVIIYSVLHRKESYR